MIPPRESVKICFAHAAYRMKTCWDALNTGIASFEVRDRAELDRRAHEADAIVSSGMWHNGLIQSATKLSFIQSISSGTDQYDKPALAAAGIRLASAAGVNARAVAEHAIGLILAMSRRLPEARDNQAQRLWRGMIGDLTQREDELGGKTLIIVGLGRIGGRLARLAKAFDMNVIGFRRDPAAGAGDADSVHGLSALSKHLPKADFVALTCPLTPETQHVINAVTLGKMRKSAYLVNVARGGCVDEPALIAALRAGTIAGAALDCTDPEPPAADCALWAMPNVLITPHTGGETTQYEKNVNEILLENLNRLWRGETALRNQIV
jgi:phosphoglycerate dehydrogenase-like enzyme